MSYNLGLWSKVSGKEICKVKKRNRVRNRRTKIVCTIGPNTQSVDSLVALIKAGLDVVRMNFSHGDHAFHLQTIKNARQASKLTKKIIGLMLDTKGPEIRTGMLKNGGEVALKAGQEFILTTDKSHFNLGDETKVYVDYTNITKVLKVGNRVLIDDGLICCLVKEVGKDYLKTKVENSGKLGQKKGVNLPGVQVDLPALTEKDKNDLAFGVKNRVDFVAASFVRKGQDVKDIRSALGRKGARIKIISKIENLEGLENFDNILKESNGIMVARGDLGVEIPLEKVIVAQKMMIAKSNLAGKPVITATQMLETMVYNPRPTRAEATDVANAVLDGSDCVMLSGETAKGKYPVKAVSTMSDICLTVEESFDYYSLYNSVRKAMVGTKVTISETICSSAVKTAEDLNASLILTATESGRTSRLVAKYKPLPPVYVVTQHETTARQLMITRGVFPFIVGSIIGREAIFKKVVSLAKSNGVLKSGDMVVSVFGNIEGVTGSTNNMKCFQSK